MGFFECGEAGNFVLEAALFLQEGGQGLGLVPRARAGELGLDVGKAFLVARRVKAAPRGW